MAGASGPRAPGPAGAARFTFTLPVAADAGAGAGAPRGTRARRHPRGRRRSADPAPCPRRAGRGGLFRAGHPRPSRSRRDHPHRDARAGPARPDAARDRRHRADAERPGTGRPAGHLHLGLRPRRDDRAGARGGRGGLHRQALLADGAHGADSGGAAPTRRPGAVRAGRPCHRLRPAPGEPGGAQRRAHRHRIRSAARPLAQRRTGQDQTDAAGPGLGRAEQRRHEGRARLRQAAAPASSATTRRALPGSSTSAGSATACPGRAPRASPDLRQPPRPRTAGLSRAPGAPRLRPAARASSGRQHRLRGESTTRPRRGGGTIQRWFASTGTVSSRGLFAK